MFRLDKVIKPWKESASLNDHINLYGFWNETTFLTKSGDVGVVPFVNAWEPFVVMAPPPCAISPAPEIRPKAIEAPKISK